MDRERVDDFLTTADDVLDDDGWTVGPDAMRWMPEGQRTERTPVISEIRSDDGRLIATYETETHTFDAEVFATAVRQIADARAEAVRRFISSFTVALPAVEQELARLHTAATGAVHVLRGARIAFAASDESDPRERALRLRRTRNTGPQQNRRAPRRIDAHASRKR